MGADAASAAVAAAAGGDTVVHDADAVDFDVHPADDDTELAVVDGTGPGIAAVVHVAGIAAAVVLGAETAAGALAVDAAEDSGRFVCALAPAAALAAAHPVHPSLASPCQSEIILTFYLLISQRSFNQFALD